MAASIYIDDTGTVEKSKSRYDPGRWKTWVAMILAEDETKLLSSILLKLQKDLKKGYSADEFHFTNIFSGKKEFKKITTQERIEIFMLFAGIYKKFRFPILVQSLTEDDITRNGIGVLRNLKVDNFDFRNIEHMTLWFLLDKISKEKIFKMYEAPMKIYVGAGKQKPNTKQTVEILKDIAINSEIIYVYSKINPLIQFIDFIAFCINRTRWILMNDKKSESDILLLRILDYVDFNTINLEKVKIELSKTKTTELYDRVLRNAYDLNGNLTDEEMAIRKK